MGAPAPLASAGVVGRLVAATTISYYGDWLTTVALIVLLYGATGDATGPAAYMLVRVAPRLLGAAPAAALAARFDPGRISAACAASQAVLLAGIVAMAHRGVVWPIYPLVATSQVLNATVKPLTSALIPKVTPASFLPRVNSLMSTLLASALFVAPAIASPLLIAFGPTLLLGIDAASFLLAAALYLTLAHVGPTEMPGGALFGGVRRGAATVLRDPMFRLFAAGYFAAGAAITAVQAVLVVAAADRFGGADRVGWCYAAVGAGGVVASIVAFRYVPRRRLTIAAAILVEVLALATLAVTFHLALALALLAISSAGGTLYQIRASVATQEREGSGDVASVAANLSTAAVIGMLTGALLVIALGPLLGWPGLLLAISGLGVAIVLLAVSQRPMARPAADAAPPLLTR